MTDRESSFSGTQWTRKRKYLKLSYWLAFKWLTFSLSSSVSFIREAVGGRGGSLFCPPFMSASAFQVRLKLHLSVNTLVSSFCPRCCANGITKRLIAEVTLWRTQLIFPRFWTPPDDSLFFFLRQKDFYFYLFYFFYCRSLIITSFGLEMEPYAIFLISGTGGAFSALPPLCSFFPGSVAKSCSAAKSHIQTKAAPGQLWLLFALGKKLSFFIKSRSHLHRMPEGVHCWEVHIWNWRCASTTHPAPCLFCSCLLRGSDGITG